MIFFLFDVAWGKTWRDLVDTKAGRRKAWAQPLQNRVGSMFSKIFVIRVVAPTTPAPATGMVMVTSRRIFENTVMNVHTAS